MAGEQIERRRAAIPIADVAGYSCLIGMDDEGTLMNEVVAAYPKTRLEVILDNLNTTRRTKIFALRRLPVA